MKILTNTIILIVFIFMVSCGSSTTPQPVIKIGQPLKTDYFEVTINRIVICGGISSDYTSEKAGFGNKFLVLETSFKNIDTESRMLLDGILFINYNGKEYKFDNSETIPIEGYGLFLDQINPLVTKKTKLVYKMPKEIKGEAYYQPGRSEDNQRISIGVIDSILIIRDNKGDHPLHAL